MTPPKEITINNARYVLVEEKKPIIIEIKSKLEVYPHDLPETMTYVDAVKAVAKLGDGWRIPTLEELRLIYKNKDGSFCTTAASGSGYPDWHWSSTEGRGGSSGVLGVRFSGGSESWHHKDSFRLSCRPVRLVAAPSLG